MNDTKTAGDISEKELKTVTFRPNRKGKDVLIEWERMGFDRTVLLNTLLAKHGEQALKDLPKLLAQLGVTPTFTRYGSHGEAGVGSGSEISSVVEHFLHTEGVAGSIPASRTMPEKIEIAEKKSGGIHISVGSLRKDAVQIGGTLPAGKGYTTGCDAACPTVGVSDCGRCLRPTQNYKASR